MIITPIKTRKFLPPKDSLDDLIDFITPGLKENSIVVISSKVISISEGRCIKVSDIDKDQLVVKEAELFIPRGFTPRGGRVHTIKHHTLISAAGIDESNGNGYYILWPKNPKASASKIWKKLRKLSKIKNLGVIITDSTAIPFRRGVTGISIAHFGFVPLRDYRGQPDIFGRHFKFEQTNIPDSLAAAAVFLMGEGLEQTPIAIITDLPKIQFTEKNIRTHKSHSTFNVPLKEDMFRGFFESAPWKKGGSHH